MFLLCSDVQNIIIMYLFPYDKLSDIEVYETILGQCNSINPNYFFQKVQIFNKLKSLYNNYSAYKHYDDPGPEKTWWAPEKYYIGGHALYDMLSTGSTLPFAASTFSKYTQDIEEDIKLLIVNNPHSMHCTFGSLRCRDHIPPLGMACINRIPIHIIEMMFLAGADPNSGYNVNGYHTHILADLYTCDMTRYLELKDLFVKYGAKINIDDP